MITREEFNASIDSGFFDDAIEYVDQLEQHIKHKSEQIECLEHNCKVKEDNAHTAYKNYLKMVNSLEQKVKDLESQLSSNPLQLTCESCVQVDCPMYLEAFNYSVVESKNDFYCNFYSPKDTK